jgi:hypothetical protein
MFSYFYLKLTGRYSPMITLMLIISEILLPTGSDFDTSVAAADMGTYSIETIQDH